MVPKNGNPRNGTVLETRGKWNGNGTTTELI